MHKASPVQGSSKPGSRRAPLGRGSGVMNTSPRLRRGTTHSPWRRGDNTGAGGGVHALKGPGCATSQALSHGDPRAPLVLTPASLAPRVLAAGTERLLEAPLGCANLPVPRQSPLPLASGEGAGGRGSQQRQPVGLCLGLVPPPPRPAQSAHTPSCHLAALLGRPAPLLWRQLWGGCSWVIIANIHPASCPPGRAGEQAAGPGQPLLARRVAAPWPGMAPPKVCRGGKAHGQQGSTQPAGRPPQLSPLPPPPLAHPWS